MNLQGQVISVSDDTALVATNRETGCDACVTDDGCGCDDLFCVTAANPIGAARGERVELRLGTGHMWGTVLVVFWLPLIFGVSGYYALFLWLDAVWAGVLGAFSGLALSVFLIRRLERRSAAGKNRSYTIIRRLGQP